MQTDSQPVLETRAAKGSSGLALLGRLMWMMWGPMLLLFISYTIITNGGWITAWDAAFVVVVALMVGGRWLEQRSGSAMTATGAVASIDNFRKYVRVLLLLAAVAWITVNILGNHFLA